MSDIIIEKKRRLVQDDAWSPEIESISAEGFTLSIKAGRHRLVLTFTDYNIRAFRRAFAEVLKTRKAKADAVAQMVNGPVE